MGEEKVEGGVCARPIAGAGVAGRRCARDPRWFPLASGRGHGERERRPMGGAQRGRVCRTGARALRARSKNGRKRALARGSEQRLQRGRARRVGGAALARRNVATYMRGAQPRLPFSRAAPEHAMHAHRITRCCTVPPALIMRHAPPCQQKVTHASAKLIHAHIHHCTVLSARYTRPVCTPSWTKIDAGSAGLRSRYLSHAKGALYQLSYRPVLDIQCTNRVLFNFSILVL